MSQPAIPNSEVLDFVKRNLVAVKRAVARRLEEIGVPLDRIGIRGVPGVESEAFTRYHRPQGGGNIRPDHPNVVSGLWQAGINIDEAIFDTNFNALAGEKRLRLLENVRAYQNVWATASVKTRLDAVGAHEFEELQAEGSLELQFRFGLEWPHYAAIRNAPITRLLISKEARELLRIHSRAVGLEI